MTEKGKKKKKKAKAAKEEEWKMYPEHKYNFPKCGMKNRKHLNNIFNEMQEYSSPKYGPISLSYFSRPNTSSSMTTQFSNDK